MLFVASTFAFAPAGATSDCRSVEAEGITASACDYRYESDSCYRKLCYDGEKSGYAATVLVDREGPAGTRIDGNTGATVHQEQGCWSDGTCSRSTKLIARGTAIVHFADGWSPGVGERTWLYQWHSTSGGEDKCGMEAYLLYRILLPATCLVVLPTLP